MNALMSRPPGAQFKVKPQNLDWKCILFPIQVPKKPGVRQVRRCLKELGFVNRRVVKRPMLYLSNAIQDAEHRTYGVLLARISATFLQMADFSRITTQ